MKRKLAHDRYPALTKALGKSRAKRARVAAVRPDPPTAAEQAAERAAADAARKALPLLMHRVANLSANTMVVPNASHAADFITAENYLGVEDSPEMRAALDASGILESSTFSRRPAGHVPHAPVYKALNVRASTVVEAFCALRPTTPLWESQHETVCFMRDQERRRALGSGGGIIADEMGKGKSLATLAFVLDRIQEHCRHEARPFGKPTLIVVPKTLLKQWSQEIARHFPPRTFSMLVLSESQNADFSADELVRNYTVVLTTYPTVVSAYKSLQPSATRRTNYGVLYKVTWERVIADEGHLFSNSDTCRFEAMCALRSHHRWVITGTPVLNDVHNVRAELQFIGVAPGFLPEIGSARNERVSGTIAAVKSTERLRSWQAEQANFEYLLRIREVLGQVMLRRRDTRERATRSVLIEQFETRAELDLYRHYEQHFRNTCLKLQRRSAEASAAGDEEADNDDDDDADDAGEAGQVPLEDGEIADTSETPVRKQAVDMITVDILRLRQTCASVETIGNIDLPPHILLDAGFDEARCAIVNGQARVAAHALLHHVRQGVLSLSYMAAAALLTRCAPVLPMERQQPQDDVNWVHALVSTEKWNALVPNRSHVARLTEMLAHVRARILPSFGTKVRMFVRYFKQQVPSDDKYIIFSEWVKVLNNIQRAFEHVGERCLMLTGGQATGERDAALRRFASDSRARVMLISMNIGSYGLNIPCANHVSHAARWWSPHTEDQAEARILRPDQLKMAHFYNIIMAGTVEEDVMRMANEKQYIARLLLENDDKTLAFIAQMRKRFENNSGVATNGETPDTSGNTPTIDDPAEAFMDALSTLFGEDAAAAAPMVSDITTGTILGKRQANGISRLVSNVLFKTNASNALK